VDIQYHFADYVLPINPCHRYNRKKYTPATIQMINNPQIMDEVRMPASKIPTLSSIAPIVRIRSFFTATVLHQSCVPVWVYGITAI